MSATTLILGIGNTLFRDEGVGVEVIRRLEGAGDLRDVNLIDGGTLSFTLAPAIADSPRLIVVDAAILNAPPGSVHVFEGEAMDQQLSGKGKSVHEVSLMDLMDMARLSGTLPRRRALVGIEPDEVDWGDTLTPAVEAAVPLALAEIRRLLARWDEEGETQTGT
jgi:hydrogenase maturation protease